MDHEKRPREDPMVKKYADEYSSYTLKGVFQDDW